MNKLKMKSYDSVRNNVAKIAALFPHCVTERLNKEGKPELAIDFDKLRAELSNEVLEEGEERYQFTWPDKRAASRLANQSTTLTLRPYSKESVGKDGTPGGFDSENLYIEGDNLDVLKVLRETYLGRVKMIYIDPPYNTGNDFVYNDDVKANWDQEYRGRSNLFDEDGNNIVGTGELVKNPETNGRFHTDWLNMIYPRLKVARDLLADDGVIFISIDDNEKENLSKICDEIFGESNFIASFPWRKRTAKTDVPFGISQDHEWIIAYAKSASFIGAVQGKDRKYFETEDFPCRPWRIHDLTKQTTASERPNSFFTIVNPKNGEKFPANPQRTWAITAETFEQYYAQNRIVFPGDYPFLNISKPALRYWKEDDIAKAGENFGKIAVSTLLPESVGMSLDGTREITNLFNGKIFSFPKPSSLITFFCKICNDKDAIVLDFFSGSATTAHAVMKLNAEDGGKRKFIMVQLPEVTDEKSEARKVGYENICEIGKERIRRSGRKVKEEAGFKGQDLDIGFRVLKLDTSNMEDVYYTPNAFGPSVLDNLIDNIKLDRKPEDLLFQVMLDLGIELSAKIETKEIAGKKVFSVDNDYLLACFDTDVNETTIEEMAKLLPKHLVIRDASAADDNVLDNFDQIIESYSNEKKITTHIL